MRPSSRRPSTAARKGFSLLELLVVAAVSSVLLLATAMMMSLISQQKANASRRLARLTQSYSAMALMERQWLNTGYHFPAARFAFRVHNNVAAGTFGGRTVGAPCAGGCIVPGTDVVELIEGNDNPLGRVVGVSVGGGDGGSGVTVFLQPPGGPVAQGDSTEYLFLFAAENGDSCIGRGNLTNGTTEFAVTMLDRDFTSQPPDFYSTAQSAPYNYNCPAQGMAMSTAIARRRYMVLEDNAGQVGLFMQQEGALGAGDGGVISLGLGVDNLQVIPLAQQGDAGWAAGCARGVCQCNAPGTDCTLTGGSSAAEFVNSGRVIGATLGVTARGEQTERLPPGAAPIPRPVVADEALAADVILRSAQTQTFLFRNFALVQP